MKKLHVLIIAILCLLVVLTACDKKQNQDIQQEGNSQTLQVNDKNEASYKESDKENNIENDIDNDKDNDIEKDEDEVDDMEENIDEDASSQLDVLGADSEYIYGDVNKSEATTYYYVSGDLVRMREEGSLDSRTLDLLSRGTRVEYLDQKGDWIKVKYNDGLGFIRKDLLSETERKEEDLSGLIISDVVEEDNSQEENLDFLDNPSIVIKKADRVLQLWDGDTLWNSYHIGLGFDPLGDKQREGDGRTPEGTYYVCTRNSASRFYLSLGLSYPNEGDAKEALDNGLINNETYEQIADSIRRGEQPPWYTPMGGEIMIHGHGSHSDWTAGCIAVDDEIMDILWDICKIGTQVIIEP